MNGPELREVLRRLPKAELHCHLDGSVRPATLVELAGECGVDLPSSVPEDVARMMCVTDAATLEEYLTRFEYTIAVMQTEAALERIAYELVADAHADGVRYIEVRNAPLLNTKEGLAPEAAVDATVRGLERGEREFGVVARFILCALRNLPPESSMEQAQLAVAHKGRGVVAFDLAGGEAGNPASRHAAAFKYAREHDLAVTVHAGEGYGVDSIRQAVHDCGADRIGHATRLFEDLSLAQYVNDRRIALEMCPTSNVQTRAVRSYADHPFRDYFAKGMNVTLNTDNRLMSGTTLTDEYLHAANEMGFTVSDLSLVALNGFASAFLPWEERLRLIESVRGEIEAIEGGVS
ncbi:MAG: adenosine deaminase [Gemmatimonadaceae bacterium]